MEGISGSSPTRTSSCFFTFPLVSFALLALNAETDPRLEQTQQSIKVRALRFTTVASKIAQAPKTIKLFVNSSSTLGFDDAESLDPAQEIELTEKQAKGEEAVQLRFVRFQNVTALSVFVASNQGDEETTRIDKLELLGQENAGTDLSQLRKGEEE